MRSNLRPLTTNTTIMIKETDKSSILGVWDHYDYIAEAEKQLKDENVYRDVEFTSKSLQYLVETSNNVSKFKREKLKNN